MSLDTDIITKERRVNFRIWMHGLGAAFIGGFATAGYSAAATLVFNHGWREAVEVACGAWIIAGLTSSFAYLKQSPLPPLPKQWNAGESV
jgi:hypothetical protein